MKHGCAHHGLKGLCVFGQRAQVITVMVASQVVTGYPQPRARANWLKSTTTRL